MMLPAHRLLREQLRAIISGKEQQVHVVVGLREELDSLPDSYDALVAFGEKLAALPLRDDWLYVEPSDLAAIWAACDPTPSQGSRVCSHRSKLHGASSGLSLLYLRLRAGQIDRDQGHTAGITASLGGNRRLVPRI
jgi:hypothetical protein